MVENEFKFPEMNPAQKVLTNKLADFVMGYCIHLESDKDKADPLLRSWNDGVATAADQILDPMDNAKIFEAVEEYFKATRAAAPSVEQKEGER